MEMHLVIPTAVEGSENVTIVLPFLEHTSPFLSLSDSSTTLITIRAGRSERQSGVMNLPGIDGNPGKFLNDLHLD
jgi:hypothetical protein